MPTIDLTAHLPGYRLLDSGAGAKLEEIAGCRVVRPSVQAIWQRRLPAKVWDQAPSICQRTSDGGGTWEHRQGDPGERLLPWSGPHGDITALLRFTSFGHCGAFFEQVSLWAWLQELVHAAGPGCKAANLFGYTGCASLAMAAAGAAVYHVDSAKGVLAWGKASQQASGLAKPAITWIHDDVRAFINFSCKRGFTYQVIYLDPPAWGHGTGKQKWTFEEHLVPLIAGVVEVLAPDGVVIISHHTPGVQRAAMSTVLGDALQAAGGDLAVRYDGDLGVCHDNDARVLPAGMYCAAAAPTASIAPPEVYRNTLADGSAHG